MKNIIVAIDGSEHASRAVDKAREIGQAFDSKIILVYVAEGLHFYDIETGAMVKLSLEKIETQRQHGETLLQRTKDSLREFGDRVETVLLEGNPPDQLIHYIEKNDADLVIVGSHGVKGFKKYMLGSVVSKIVHHVDRSILIVR